MDCTYKFVATDCAMIEADLSAIVRVEIAATDCAEGDPNDRVCWLFDGRDWNGFKSDAACASKDKSFHHYLCDLILN